METAARTTLDAPGPNPAPDRCTARARRIAAIKFVALPLEHGQAGETDLPVPAGRPSILRRIFQLLSSFRASGRLEAARP
jgi:hypothetical protein